MAAEPRSDAWLGERARQALRGHDRFVVAEVRDGVVRRAAVGLPESARLEIGSVSKGLTGMLLAHALEREEVRDETTLGALLPLHGAPAGDVRLVDVATHHSGLPRLPRQWSPARGMVRLLRHGTNPYGQSVDELVAAARRVDVGPPRARYSNLGFMLLGHALAAAADRRYVDLLRDRITGPLGMGSTTAPASTDELDARDVAGRSRYGRVREPWIGEALAPAGGVRCTADDLARLVAGLIDGTAAGTDALVPRRDLRGPMRVGYGWMTLDSLGAEIVWLGGATGGFRCWVGLDRGAGVGIAIASATTRSVDRAGITLVTAEGVH